MNLKTLALLSFAAPAYAAVSVTPLSGRAPLSAPRASLAAAPLAASAGVRAALPAAAPAAAPAVAAAPALAAPAARTASFTGLKAMTPSLAAPAFDGARLGAYWGPDGVEFSPLMPSEAPKIKDALDLAMQSQLGAAIKNGLANQGVNTVYRVDRKAGRKVESAVRTLGSDPELANERNPLIVFSEYAIDTFSPYYLAAKMAGMWARHLYKDTIPASAEKTYIEGSVAVRVFMELTGSTIDVWRGDLDVANGANFEMFRHAYFWDQGFRYPNVMQGPYFKDKIMGNDSQPRIDTDRRGRRTLYERAQNGEITQQAAADAQTRFDGFTSNER